MPVEGLRSGTDRTSSEILPPAEIPRIADLQPVHSPVQAP